MNKKKFNYILIVLSIVLIGWQGTSLYNKMYRHSRKDTVVAISNASVDCGTVKAGDTATAVFTIVNIGGSELFIDEITPECHCTVADWNRDAVAPGDSTRITARIVEYSPIGYYQKMLSVKANVRNSPLSLIIAGRYE